MSENRFLATVALYYDDPRQRVRSLSLDIEGELLPGETREVVWQPKAGCVLMCAVLVPPEGCIIHGLKVAQLELIRVRPSELEAEARWLRSTWVCEARQRVEPDELIVLKFGRFA